MAKNKTERAAEQAAETVVPVEETASPAVDTEAAAEPQDSAELRSEELTVGERVEGAENVIAWPCYRVTAPNGLNLRVGPGKSYPVAKILPMDAVVVAAGFPIEVPGCSWLQVTSEGCVTGWVDTAYLEANGEYGVD